MLLLSQYNYNQHLVCNNFNILVTLSLTIERILDVPTFNTRYCIKQKQLLIYIHLILHHLHFLMVILPSGVMNGI